MSKEEIINNTISKYHDECSKITETEFIDKLKKYEEIMIKVILDTVLNND